MLFNSKKRKFAALLNTACQSMNPREQLVNAEQALDLIDTLDPWPRSIGRCRRRTKAVLHGVLGQAYGNLARIEPDKYGQLELQANAIAEQYFRPEDDEDWVLFQLHFAQSTCSKQEASLEDYKTAIQRLEKLLQHPFLMKDTGLRSSILSGLVNLYTDVESDDVEQAREQAIRYGSENVKLLAKAHNKIRLAQSNLSLGQAYSKRLLGNLIDNREKSVFFIRAGIDNLDKNIHALEWARGQAILSMACDAEHESESREYIKKFKLSVSANDAALTVFNKNDPQTCVDWARVQFNRVNIFARQAERDGDPAHHRAAQDAIDSSLEVYTESRFPDQYAQLMGKRASLDAKRLDPGNPDQIQESIARAKFELSRKNREIDPFAWAQIQARIAGFYFELPVNPDRERYLEEAIERWEEALDIIGLDNNKREWLRITGNLANAYAYRITGDAWRNIEQAINLQEDALKHLSPEKDLRWWTEATINLAESYLDRQKGIWADNVEQVIDLLESASTTVHKVPRHGLRYRWLKLLARAYNERVRGDALQNSKKAFRAIQDAWEEPIDKVSGDYLLAAKLNQRIVGLEQSAKQPTYTKRTSSKEKLEAHKASNADLNILDQYRKRIAEIDRTRHPVQWIQGQVAFGNAMLFFGPDSVRWDNKDGSPPSTLADGFREAFMALDAGLKFAQEQCFTQELDYIHRHRAQAAKSLAMLRNIDDLRGFYNAEQELPSEEARQFLEHAVESQKIVANNAPIEANERAHLYENLELGVLHVYLRQWRDASEAFAAAGRGAEFFLADIEVSDTETRRLLEVMDSWMELAPFAAVMCGLNMEAIRFVEQGRARLLTKTTGLALLNLSETSMQRLHDLREELLACENKLNSKTLINRMTPLRRTIEIRSELREISQTSIVPSLSMEGDPEHLLRSLLNEKTCIVIPLISSFGGYILIASMDQDEVKLETLRSGSSFEFSKVSKGTMINRGVSTRSLVRDFDWNYEESAKQCLPELCEKIGALVTETLFKKLKNLSGGRIENIILLPQGIWGHLPLSLGNVGNNGSPLLEHYTVSMTPSLRLLKQVSAETAGRLSSQSIAFIANPTHADQYLAEPLEFSDIELALVSQHVDIPTSNILSEEMASKEAVLRQLKNSSIWHFACHGSFDQNDAQNTRLFLAGEDVLTASDLLENPDLARPNLVVLSACETGLFDQKELPFEFSGLISAFLQTGAKGVIVSLWRVSDIATCLLMTSLYERVFKGGETVSSSLRKAQLWLRDLERSDIEKQIQNWSAANVLNSKQVTLFTKYLEENQGNYPFADPFYWGGFVYYGASNNRPNPKL